MPHHPTSPSPPHGGAHARPRLWNRAIMGWPYEWLVIRGTYRWLWDCPWPHVDQLYTTTVRTQSTHVEIGPGNGYFLNRLGFNGELDLHLLDLHPGPLGASAHRLARFGPKLHIHDALHPFPLQPASVDSVAMSMVLHCLPGHTIPAKADVFDHIRQVLRPGGWCIGATVLSHGAHLSGRGRSWLRVLNDRGVFANRDDSYDGLAAVLNQRFVDVDITVHGAVALWQGRRPTQ